MSPLTLTLALALCAPVLPPERLPKEDRKDLLEKFNDLWLLTGTCPQCKGKGYIPLKPGEGQYGGEQSSTRKKICLKCFGLQRCVKIPDGPANEQQVRSAKAIEEARSKYAAFVDALNAAGPKLVTEDKVMSAKFILAARLAACSFPKELNDLSMSKEAHLATGKLIVVAGSPQQQKVTGSGGTYQFRYERTTVAFTCEKDPPQHRSGSGYTEQRGYQYLVIGMITEAPAEADSKAQGERTIEATEWRRVELEAKTFDKPAKPKKTDKQKQGRR